MSLSCAGRPARVWSALVLSCLVAAAATGAPVQIQCDQHAEATRLRWRMAAAAAVDGDLAALARRPDLMAWRTRFAALARVFAAPTGARVVPAGAALDGGVLRRLFAARSLAWSWDAEREEEAGRLRGCERLPAPIATDHLQALPDSTVAWLALRLEASSWPAGLADALPTGLDEEWRSLLLASEGDVVLAITDEGALPGCWLRWPRSPGLDALLPGLLAERGARQLDGRSWRLPLAGWWQVEIAHGPDHWQLVSDPHVARRPGHAPVGLPADGLPTGTVLAAGVDWRRLAAVWEPLLGLGLGSVGRPGQSQRWWDVATTLLPATGTGFVAMQRRDAELRWTSRGLGGGPGLWALVVGALHRGPMAAAPLAVWGSDAELAAVRLRGRVWPALRDAGAAGFDGLEPAGWRQGLGGYRYRIDRAADESRWLVYAWPVHGRGRTFALLDDGRLFAFSCLGRVPRQDDLWERGDWSAVPRWAPCHWYENLSEERP